jgi:hypothetical protein
MMFLRRRLAVRAASAFSLSVISLCPAIATAGLVHQVAALPTKVNSTAPGTPPRATLRPESIRLRHTDITSGQTYAIDDIGAPNDTVFTVEQPIGFNNTGQFFGSGSTNKRPGEGAVCETYTGYSWVNISSNKYYYDCTANAISENSENNNGNYYVVGAIQQLTDMTASAFVASITTRTISVDVETFTSAAPFSAMYAVGLGGSAYGTAYDLGFGGGVDQAPFTSPTRKRFEPLQPACASPGSPLAGCLIGRNPYGECPFGECNMNTNGLLLGYEYSDPAFT